MMFLWFIGFLAGVLFVVPAYHYGKSVGFKLCMSMVDDYFTVWKGLDKIGEKEIK